MKPKRTLSGYILLIGVMGLSIVGGIVAFQIFSAVTKSQVSNEQSTLTKSLDGSIDQKIIENLQSRTKFSESQLNTVVSQTVTPTSIPVATSGGNIVVAPAGEGASPSAGTQ